MDKDKLIYELWQIIDNIDTISDIAQTDHEVYRSMVEREQHKRWGVLSENYLIFLYSKYHNGFSDE